MAHDTALERDLHRRRQHGDRADRRPDGAGAAPARLPRRRARAAQRDQLAARFPGVGIVARAIGPPRCAAPDIVVLAVKPQHDARGRARARERTSSTVPVVLTIAAGIRLADLARWLGGYRRIVRAMPNTPALDRRAASRGPMPTRPSSDAAHARLRHACWPRRARWSGASARTSSTRSPASPAADPRTCSSSSRRSSEAATRARVSMPRWRVGLR